MRVTQQSLLCADDSDSAAENITTTVRQHKSALLVVSKEDGMIVTAIKATQAYTVMYCGERAGQSHKYRCVSTCMDNTSFPKVTNFEYRRRH